MKCGEQTRVKLETSLPKKKILKIWRKVQVSQVKSRRNGLQGNIFKGPWKYKKSPQSLCINENRAFEGGAVWYRMRLRGKD